MTVMNMQQLSRSKGMNLTFSTVMFVLLLFSQIALLRAHAQESRSGNFKALVERQGGAKDATETNHWSVRVEDRAGRELYRVSKEIPFDVQFPAVHVSDTEGRMVVVQPLNGTVEFHDGRGGLTNTVSFAVTDDLDYERILKCSVAGNRVAVLTSENNDQARLVMCSIEGRELWRRTLAGRQAGEIMLSASGDVVVAGSYSFTDHLEASTEMFDGEGLKLRELAGIFRYADISPDNQRVALAAKNRATIEALEDGSEFVQYQTTSGSHIITGLKFVGNYLAVVVEDVEFEEGRPRYRPSLVMLDNQAKPVTVQELNVVATAPALLTIDGDTIVLRSGNQSATLDVKTINR